MTKNEDNEKNGQQSELKKNELDVGSVFTDTKDKAFKFISDNVSDNIFVNPLYRRLTIMGLAIAGGLFAGYLAAVGSSATVITWAAIGGVLGGMLGDTLRIRAVRQLVDEQQQLNKYNNAINKKKQLLATKPELAKWLQNELTSKKNLEVGKIGQAINFIKNIIKLNAPNQLAKLEQMTSPKQISLGGLEINLFPNNQKSTEIAKNREGISELSKELSKKLEGARKEVGYNSMTELAKLTREERIKNIALTSLSSKQIKSEAQAKDLFRKAVARIERTELAIQEKRNPIKYIGRMIQDFKESNKVNSGLNVPANIKQALEKDKELEVEHSKLLSPKIIQTLSNNNVQNTNPEQKLGKNKKKRKYYHR